MERIIRTSLLAPTIKQSPASSLPDCPPPFIPPILPPKEKELVEATMRIKELLKEVESRDQEVKHSESMFNIMTLKHNALNSGERGVEGGREGEVVGL